MIAEKFRPSFSEKGRVFWRHFQQSALTIGLVRTGKPLQGNGSDIVYTAKPAAQIAVWAGG